MANRWYVALDGEELGPLSDTGLERLIQGGRVDSATMVRNGASGEWMSVEIAEELLAARPSRERPGEAAIQAARQAKQANQRPPAQIAPPPPAQMAPPPPAKTAPPPLPPASQAVALAEPTAASPASATVAGSTNGAPASPPALEAPPSPGRARLVRIGAFVAGGALIFAATFSAGWFAFHSSPSSSPPLAPAAVNPELTALQQQADQLRRELEEAKQQLASPAPAAAPESSSSPADAASDDSQPADRSPTSAPASDAAPQAAAKPASPAMKEAPPAPESKPVDLAAERKDLATLIAAETAVEKERDERVQFLKQFQENPQVEFKSEFAAAVDKHLVAAELEADKLDAQQVALRRKELEEGQNARRKQAAKLLAETKSAATEANVALAVEKASDYFLIAPPEEITSAVALLRELDLADPWVVYAKLATVPVAELQRVIAEGRLPDDWPKPSADRAVIESVRKSAVRLAPMVLSMTQTKPLLERFAETQKKLDLATRRKLLFLFEAEKLHDSGELDEGNVRRLVSDFGAFNVEDLAPLIDSVLAKDARETADGTAKAYIPAVARGKIQRITLRQLYDECRKMTGDAWPADDQLHPLAGLWEGPSTWQVHIDPRQEEVAWSRASPKIRIVQRLCKIGPDYLVAYENRSNHKRESSNYPFRKGKALGDEPRPGFVDLLADKVVHFTYYALAQDGETLAINRVTVTAPRIQDDLDREFWRALDKSDESAEWPGEFRRVAAQPKP